MENPQQQVTEEPSFWVQPPAQAYPKEEPMLSRNLVIFVIVAFIAGLLLGKVMNPTILNMKH
jgi:hypothetical protein